MKTTSRMENLQSYAFLATRFRNGFELIRAYRDGSNCDVAIRWDGTRIVHPQNRAGFVGTMLEILQQRCYTPRDFYRPQAGDTIVDAGAHVGLFSISVATAAPDSRVLALEPFEENYRCLVANLTSANLDNVTALNCAVGGHDGHAYMQAVGTRSIDHLLTDESDDHSTRVRVISLPGILETLKTDDVAFLKMDVEGAEADAFGTAKQDVVASFRRIALEYHDNLRPGTLAILRERLAATHDVVVNPTFDRGYGVLLATRRQRRA